MRCDVVVISYMFDFLAARAIEAMAPTRPIVIDVRKDGASHLISQARARLQCLPGRHFHHQVVEDVMSGKFTEITGDLVMFADHDVAWPPGHFSELLERWTTMFEENPNLHVICPSLNYPRGTTHIFGTMICFMVRRSELLASGWHPTNVMNDTGQALISSLLATNPDAVIADPMTAEYHGPHVASGWLNHHEATRRGETWTERWQKFVFARTTKALVDGKFSPEPSERLAMQHFEAFREFLDLSSIYFEDLEANDILLVGNAHVRKSFAHIVDRYRDVVRMNQFRTIGFEDLVGSKTTIAAFNPIVEWNTIEQGDYQELWPFSKTAASHIPPGIDKKITVMYDDNFWEFVCKKTQEYNADVPKKITLSMGTVTTLKILQLYRKPTLVNFDWAETGHYFNPSVSKLWSGHPWQKEREFMARLQRAGLINIIRPEDL